MSPQRNPTCQPKIDHVKSFPGIIDSWSLVEKSDLHNFDPLASPTIPVPPALSEEPALKAEAGLPA